MAVCNYYWITSRQPITLFAEKRTPVKTTL